MTLRLRFWGTRGSIPSPGPHTVRHGGNTPCVEVRTDSDWLIILDAGTGMRELGHALVGGARDSRGQPHPDGDDANVITGDIFLSHAHWDHIQGIPFFAPIFQAGNRFTIWSGALDSPAASIERVVRNQMAPIVFPVWFENLRASIEFREIAGEYRSDHGYTVSTFGVQHPGGALAYRFSSGQNPRAGSFVYISDNELGSSEGYGTGPGWRDDLIAFVHGARVLVHDATYTTDEYARHRGWGHSTYEDAVTLALEAGVDELILFHHKPERSDDEMDQCVAACRVQAERHPHGARLRVVAAAEGMTVSV